MRQRYRWPCESCAPIALCSHSLMLALPLGLGWHQGVPLTAGAGDVRKKKVATVQDARSVHGGDQGWAG